MQLLEDKIRKEGVIIGKDILKVDSFINHQLDPVIMEKSAEEFARLFEGEEVTKILTVEASGIAIAIEVARIFKVPAVFAKKKKSLVQIDDFYCSKVMSFTHKTENNITVSKKYISPEDKVLIIDDFLAVGNAIKGLIDIVNQAGAKVVGCGALIEKGFQNGGAELRAAGYHVETLAIIESMDGDKGEIIFRKQ